MLIRPLTTEDLPILNELLTEASSKLEAWRDSHPDEPAGYASVTVQARLAFHRALGGEVRIMGVGHLPALMGLQHAPIKVGASDVEVFTK